MKTLQKHSITYIRNWLIKLFMKRKFNGLLGKLTALALGFSVFGCHNTSEIGFGLGDDGLLTAIYTDTLNVGYSTVLSDSAVNGNAIYLLTGKINDPEFGPIEAVSYFQPSLTPQYNGAGTMITNDAGSILYDTLKLSGTPIIDSLKLGIYVDGLVYGDTNAVSKFRIHRLSNIMQTRNYDASEKQTYDPAPLAEFEVTLPSLRHDSTRVLLPKLVSLPKEITKELIESAAAAKGNNSTFLSQFRGFAIVPDKANKAVYGFRTGYLDLQYFRHSSLVPFWHMEGDTTSKVYVFNLNGPRYSSLTHDRSATALSKLTKSKNELSLTETGGKLYIQSGSGISPKIDLSSISRLGKVKIAKAVLEFQGNPATINGFYRKNYYFVLAETGINNQQKRNGSNQLTYIYNGGTEVAGEFYVLNDSTNYLNVDITKYLQKLEFSGDLNKSVLLLPASVNTTSGVGTLGNDNLSRMVFLKPRLLLYYNKN
jgi:hypothetical protein